MSRHLILFALLGCLSVSCSRQLANLKASERLYPATQPTQGIRMANQGQSIPDSTPHLASQLPLHHSIPPAFDTIPSIQPIHGNSNRHHFRMPAKDTLKHSPPKKSHEKLKNTIGDIVVTATLLSPLATGIFIYAAWFVGLLLSFGAFCGFVLLLIAAADAIFGKEKPPFWWIFFGVLVVIFVIVAPFLFYHSLVSSAIILLGTILSLLCYKFLM